MPLTTNPLVPTSYDLVWSVAVATILVVTLAAAISVVRHLRGLTSAATALWLLLVLLVPPVGGIAWFVAGRGRAKDEIDRLYPETAPLR